MLLLEPAFATADVLLRLKRNTLAPLFPFSMSGEYTTLTPINAPTSKREFNC